MSQWETLGYIGVDSGTIMVVDPCYVIPDELWSDSCHEFDDKKGFDKRYAEMADGGIHILTAHGDGSYAVEALRDSRGVITEIRVRFN